MTIRNDILATINSAARAMVNAKHYTDILNARLATLREAGVTLGDARVCEYAQAFRDGFKAAGLSAKTIPPYLSAMRKALETGEALDKSRGANAKAKEGKEEKTERTPMSLAERLRRAKGDAAWSSFVELADKLAKTGASLDTIVEQYIASRA